MKKGGMDKTSWIAAGLCMLLLVLYPKIVSHFYPPDPNAAKKKAEKAAQAASHPTNAPVAASAPASAPQLLAKESLAPGAVTRTTPEQTAVLENPAIRVVFTTWAGE